MERTIRFRIDGLNASDWKEDFQTKLRSGPAIDAVKLLPSTARPDGLALADVVLVAVVTGGASVLVAAITAIASIYAARLSKKEDKPPSSPAPIVVVNLIGSKASAQVNVTSAYGVSVSELDRQLAGIGQLREISI
jgi:hypothetical protein